MEEEEEEEEDDDDDMCRPFSAVGGAGVGSLPAHFRFHPPPKKTTAVTSRVQRGLLPRSPMLRRVLRCVPPASTRLAFTRPLAHFRPHMDPDPSRPVERAIRTKLSESLQPDHLEVHNESHMHAVPPGSESHFRVLVVSSRFDGLPLIQRHRLVNEALKQELSGCVHALAIQAKTLEQWGGDPTLGKSPACMGGSRGDRTVEEKLKAGRE